MLRIYIEIYLFVLISVVLFMHCTYMFAYFIYIYIYSFNTLWIHVVWTRSTCHFYGVCVQKSKLVVHHFLPSSRSPVMHQIPLAGCSPSSDLAYGNQYISTPWYECYAFQEDFKIVQLSHQRPQLNRRGFSQKELLLEFFQFLFSGNLTESNESGETYAIIVLL